MVMRIRDLLVDLLRLVAACRLRPARFGVAPAAELLELTLGPLAPRELLLQAVPLFELEAGGAAPALISALDPLVCAVEAAAQRESAREQLAQAGEVIRTLLAISTLGQEQLTQARLYIGNPATFRALRYARLDAVPGTLRGGAGVITMLAGSPAPAAGPLVLPGWGEHGLDQIQLAYAPGDLYPQLSTAHWVRIPPDPNRQRMQSRILVSRYANRQIEIYRRSLPGEGPLLVITCEPLRFPLEITRPGLSVVIEAGALPLSGMRTIVRDKFRTTLLQIDHLQVADECIRLFLAES